MWFSGGKASQFYEETVLGQPPGRKSVSVTLLYKQLINIINFKYL